MSTLSTIDMADLVSKASPSPSMPRDADAPFNNRASTDVILRSADKVGFHVHKLILTLSSPFFENLFSITQPVSTGDTSIAGNPIANRPVIDVLEDASIIDFIMRCCYPIAKPPLKELPEVRAVFDAAQKYGMVAVVVTSVAQDALIKLANEHPLDVMSISLRCDMYDAFCKAFQYATKFHSLLLIESGELDRLSMLQYHQLLQYVKKRPDSVHPQAAWGSGVPRGVQLGRVPPSSAEFNALKELRLKRDIPRHFLRQCSSKAQGPFDDRNADIILRSCDGVDFYAYKAILSIASPFFKDMFSLPQTSVTSANRESISEPPIIDVAEDARTLDFVLRSIYPVQLPDFKGTDIYPVLEAGRKYDIKDAASAAEAALIALTGEDAIVAFSLAVQCQMEDICTMAVRRLLKVQVMDRSFLSTKSFPNNISARPFRKFMQYHQQCGRAASAVASSRAWFSNYLGVVSTSRSCTACFFEDKQDGRDSGWFAHPQVWEYLKKAKGTLLFCPHSDSVLSSSEPINVSCGQCGRSSYGRDLCHALRSAVEAATAEDKIEIPKFC